MHLIRKTDAPFVTKRMEARRYYLPDRDPLEVIETKMAPNASQSAHSHQIVREAMLVLEGKVSIEEIILGNSFHQTLDAGDFVVFDCGVSHRIANNSDIPARTVHFKFLGEGKDRALFASDKTDISTVRTPTASIPEIYTQDYRHFDNLIWQVPAWASAIFSFSITGAVIVLANGAKIERLFPTIDTPLSISIFLFSVFLVLLLLLNVFLRFRLHQRLAFRPNRREVPSLWYMLSGQSSLLLVLFIEATVILCFALITAGIDLFIAKSAAAVFLLVGFSYIEISVRRLSAILKTSRNK